MMEVLSPELVLAQLYVAYPYPYSIILAKDGTEPFVKGTLSGSFPTAAGCVDDLFKNRWLDLHVNDGDPLVFTFERKVDLRKFKKMTGRFKALGYQEVPTAFQS
ncbi:hypothetical protein [Rhizobium sp. P007]|uniref:hypothetical protein n=1 Tax=Rhizobium sp. P007 TaxID=285908 RepID=UPI001158F033|nr:hypothetical protein [Rhizobium sp. P007]CAD7042315.1 hypothetical protein RP007_00865 [Rhizobium sp. P007]